ncbi:MAG: hypothetical protein JSU91_01810 [Thermoplasmatales archaeon]|nr:MAG: hypothetical protein JSU91_01810 [Thermoplasmatales archaeon]
MTGFTSRSIENYIQDQTTAVVDYFVCRDLFDLEISENTVLEAYIVNVVDASSVVAGTYLCIQEGQRALQVKVLSINVNEITIDTPLDYAFTTSATIKNRSPELNVNGSSTPVIGSLKPIIGVKWDITRIFLNIVCSSEPDDSKFGDLASLTKGIVLRKKDGDHRTIFNVKNNGEFAQRCVVTEYTSKSGGGAFGVRAIRAFSGQDNNGVSVRLNGNAGDELQIIIQDDLSTLNSFRIVAQGHIVEE